MRAISVRADYCNEFLTGDKPAEYRTWSTKHRGELLICSTAQKIAGTIPGHALFVAYIDDVVYNGGIYEWRVNYAKSSYIEPFKVKGQQGFYNVSDDLIHKIDDSAMSEQQFKEVFGKFYVPLFYGIKK